MNLDHLFTLLWKHRLLFAIAVVLFTGVVAAATFTLPKSYRATATLLVGNTEEINKAAAFDTAIGERLTRTYTTLAGNPNVAAEVARALPFELTNDALLAKMSFAPIERTQLLEMSAEDESPTRTRLIANRYADVFVKRIDGQVKRGTAPTTISISEPASLPRTPVRPKPALYLGLGLPLALLLALGVVLARERLDDRINGDADELLGLPVLGRFPMITGRGATTGHEAADILRLLRTRLDLTPGGRPLVLGFTSGSQGEGKSTLCANFALTAAADGERVVIVEADMRSPGLASTILGKGLDIPTSGLSRYLVGSEDAASAIFSHQLPGVSVVWAGPLPPNPAALLASDRMGQLIAHLRSRYDRVLIDTPPILLGADATLALNHADATLFVVNVRATKCSQAGRGLGQLRMTGVALAGVLFNRVERPRTSEYGYYSSETPGRSQPTGRVRRKP